MRSFSERILVLVASLIFLSIAFLVRHAVVAVAPVVIAPPPKAEVSEFPPRGATFVRQRTRRWWSTPAPPADPVIVPAPQATETLGGPNQTFRNL